MRIRPEERYLDEDDIRTPETCDEFVENNGETENDPCATCEHYTVCWGESPWASAIAEYERSR